jgi:hypothetical protein
MKVYKHEPLAMCNTSDSHIMTGEQHRTIEEIMEAMAKVSFPTKADDLGDALYPRQGQHI